MLPIVQSPDPMLNQVCEDCEVGDEDLKTLASQMIEAMYESDGVGLAAPQVGVLKRLIVVDCSEEQDDSFALVNPVIEETWGDEETDMEGCLSCPGISVPIKRPSNVRVSYYDLDGESWLIEADGLLARCLQHEIDHLNGITLFERCAPRDRIKALTAYEEARKLGAKPGDTSIAKVR